SPEKAYQQGHYVESVLNMVDIIAQQPNQAATNKQITRLQSLVTNVTQHYQQQINQSATNDFPARIEAYSALLALRQQLDPLPLRQYVANFSQHYTIASLQKALAKEYYDYARALPGQDVQAYLERSRLYWQSTQ